MNKKWLILYIIFVLYTLISMFFGRSVTIDFYALFMLEGDPLLVATFNMLGIFPIFYILYGLSFGKQKWYVYTLFALGFMMGAFAIMPALMLMNRDKKHVSTWKRTPLILIPLILVLISMIGILFGDLSAYGSLFLSDQFVHIMTIDFFVLLLLPYADGANKFLYVHLIDWSLR